MRPGAAIVISQTDVATAQGYASTLKPMYESDAMKTVREGVNLLVDSLPGLVKALDEVAKLHPFIGSTFSSYFMPIAIGPLDSDLLSCL